MHGDTLPPVQLTGTIFNYDKACTIGKLMRNAYMQTYSTQFAFTCDTFVQYAYTRGSYGRMAIYGP